jgi:CHAT domain-containing protein/tetratricopeptide (TPR) repeat protein
VEVGSPDLDVQLGISGPSASASFNVDVSGAGGAERLRFLAETAGEWFIDVSVFGERASGHYELVVPAARPPTEMDLVELEADSLHHAGVMLLEVGDYQRAAELLRQTVHLKESVPEVSPMEMVQTLSDLSVVLRELGETEAAIDGYSRAMEIAEAAKGSESLEVATVLAGFGLLYGAQGRYGEAEKAFRRAIEIREPILGKDNYILSSTLASLGQVLVEAGRWREAEPVLLEAFSGYQRSLGPDDVRLGGIHTHLQVLYWEQGLLQDAEFHARRSFEILQPLLPENHPFLAGVQNNMAQIYGAMGRSSEAQILQSRALAILEGTHGPEHSDVHVYRSHLADFFREAGRYEEADSLFRESLSSLEVQLREVGSGEPILEELLAEQRNSYGSLLKEMGRLDEAESMFEASSTALRRLNQDYSGALSNLADIYGRTGRAIEAWALHQEVLEYRLSQYASDHPSVGRACTRLAENALESGVVSPDSALALANRGAEILGNAFGYPQWRIEAYSIRSRVLEWLGDRERALEDLEEAIRDVEELRPRAAGAEEGQVRFFEGFAELYDRMVRLQLEDDNFESALEFAERGRARLLLDQLELARVDLRSSLPSDLRQSLEARERAVVALMSELIHRETLLRSQEDLATLDRANRLESLADSLAVAQEEYRSVRSEIRNASGTWSGLYGRSRPEVRSRSVQRDLLAEKEVLLLYQIGDAESFLLIVPALGGDPTWVSLEVGEAAAATLGVQAGPVTNGLLDDLLVLETEDGSRRASILSLAVGGEARRTRSTAVGAAMASLDEHLHALWQVLIPPRIKPTIDAASAVVIVPDGSLHVLPFDALVVRFGDSGSNPAYWLDEGPVVRYAPSAAVLAHLSGRANLGALEETGGVLSLSDPVFDPAGADVSRRGAAKVADAPKDPAAAETVTRDEFVRSGGTLRRLPGTEAETDAIVDALRTESGTPGFSALRGLDATEDQLRTHLPGKRFLHLATHGLVDERKGGLFAALALTPPPGETADPVDDGFLQLYEIYDLPLDQVELAVLSACESNVGFTTESEGVFALSRGFLAAGARRVISTQWAVDDESTAQLIGEFFRRIFDEKTQGRDLDYAGALWEAKRKVRGDPAWADPYYWAPFVIVGQR